MFCLLADFYILQNVQFEEQFLSSTAESRTATRNGTSYTGQTFLSCERLRYRSLLPLSPFDFEWSPDDTVMRKFAIVDTGPPHLVHLPRVQVSNGIAGYEQVVTLGVCGTHLGRADVCEMWLPQGIGMRGVGGGNNHSGWTPVYLQYALGRLVCAKTVNATQVHATYANRVK